MPTYDETPLITSSPFKVTEGGTADVPLNLSSETVSPLMTFAGCVNGPAFPVYGAHIGIYDTDYNLKADTQTDSEGNYTLSAQLRTGRYCAMAAAAGYVPSGYMPLQIYGQSLCVLDFYLRPKVENAGSLSGIVKSLSGAAIPDARISVYYAATCLYAAGGISDKDGRYAINDLSPACCYITASAAGYYALYPFAVGIAPLQNQRLDLMLQPVF